MRRTRIAAAWAVFLVLSYFYWDWIVVHVHDGKTIRASLVCYLVLALGVLTLLAKMFRLKPPTT